MIVEGVLRFPVYLTQITKGTYTGWTHFNFGSYEWGYQQYRKRNKRQ